MNEQNAKSTVILESIRTMFIADSVDTTYDVREIFYYTGQRIIRSFNAVGVDFPQITMVVDEAPSEILLPSGVYFVTLKCWQHLDNDLPHETVDNMAARCIFLLNGKHIQLNTQVSSKNLRCRLIQKQSNTKGEDATLKAIYRQVIFKLTCDDEILQCN